MADTKHTPGPWEITYRIGSVLIGTQRENVACVVRYNGRDPMCVGNAARIVACVNALEGLTDDEVAALPDSIEIYAATRPEAGRWESKRIQELEDEVRHLEGRISAVERDVGGL